MQTTVWMSSGLSNVLCHKILADYVHAFPFQVNGRSPIHAEKWFTNRLNNVNVKWYYVDKTCCQDKGGGTFIDKYFSSGNKSFWAVSLWCSRCLWRVLMFRMRPSLCGPSLIACKNSVFTVHLPPCAPRCSFGCKPTDTIRSAALTTGFLSVRPLSFCAAHWLWTDW